MMSMVQVNAEPWCLDKAARVLEQKKMGTKYKAQACLSCSQASPVGFNEFSAATRLCHAALTSS